MGWKKLAGADEGDKPRKLSYKEIKDILDKVQCIESLFSKAASLAHKHLVEHVAKLLQEIELCPSMVKEMANRIIVCQVRHACEPGYPMGSATGSAMGSFNMPADDAEHIQVFLCQRHGKQRSPGQRQPRVWQAESQVRQTSAQCTL